MSNIIPIVSSSPPPFDDDGGWDEDDDDFGNFASAPVSKQEDHGFEVDWSNTESTPQSDPPVQNLTKSSINGSIDGPPVSNNISPSETPQDLANNCHFDHDHGNKSVTEAESENQDQFPVDFDDKAPQNIPKPSTFPVPPSDSQISPLSEVKNTENARIPHPEGNSALASTKINESVLSNTSTIDSGVFSTDLSPLSHTEIPSALQENCDNVVSPNTQAKVDAEISGNCAEDHESVKCSEKTQALDIDQQKHSIATESHNAGVADQGHNQFQQSNCSDEADENKGDWSNFNENVDDEDGEWGDFDNAFSDCKNSSHQDKDQSFADFDNAQCPGDDGEASGLEVENSVHDQNDLCCSDENEVNETVGQSHAGCENEQTTNLSEVLAGSLHHQDKNRESPGAIDPDGGSGSLDVTDQQGAGNLGSEYTNTCSSSDGAGGHVGEGETKVADTSTLAAETIVSVTAESEGFSEAVVVDASTNHSPTEESISNTITENINPVAEEVVKGDETHIAEIYSDSDSSRGEAVTAKSNSSRVEEDIEEAVDSLEVDNKIQMAEGEVAHACQEPEDDKEFGDFSTVSLDKKASDLGEEVTPITFRTSVCEDNAEEEDDLKVKPPAFDDGDDDDDDDDFGDFGDFNTTQAAGLHEASDDFGDFDSGLEKKSAGIEPPEDSKEGGQDDDDADFGDFGDASATVDQDAGWADFGSASTAPPAQTDSSREVDSHQSIATSHSVELTGAQGDKSKSKVLHALEKCFPLPTMTCSTLRPSWGDGQGEETFDVDASEGGGETVKDSEPGKEGHSPGEITALEVVVELGLANPQEARQQTWTVVQHPAK